MTHTHTDIPLDQLLVEHYLFDLNLPVDKVAEVAGMDKDHVRDIYEQASRLRTSHIGVSSGR